MTIARAIGWGLRRDLSIGQRASRSSKESPGAHGKDGHEEDIDHSDPELRKENAPEGIEEPDDERSEEGAPETSETPDDHDDEAGDNDRRIHGGEEADSRSMQRPPEPCERRSQEENGGVNERDIEPQCSQHLPILRRGADLTSPPRLLGQKPETRSDRHTCKGEEEEVVRILNDPEVGGPIQPLRNWNGEHIRSPNHPGEVPEDEDQGKGEEKLVGVIFSV